MSPALADRTGHEIDDAPLPRRPRRHLLTGPSAVLFAAVTCAAGFYVGVRVEKGQASSGTGTLSVASGARRTGTAQTAGLGGSAGLAAGGSAGAIPSFAGTGGRGAPVAGTVSSVDGRTVVVKQGSGDTVKVRLSTATTINKTEKKTRAAIHPGDTVTVSGTTAKSGTVSAASVSDSGNTASGSSTGGSGTGATSAIGSLFGG